MEKASEVLTMVIASGFEVRSMSFTRIYRVLEKLMSSLGEHTLRRKKVFKNVNSRFLEGHF